MSEQKINDFNYLLEESEKYDKKIQLAAHEHIIKNNLIKSQIKFAQYQTDSGKKLQRSGIDSKANYNTLNYIEAKRRRPDSYIYYNKDILLETISIIHSGKLGWLYTSKADFIAYTWSNSKNETCDIGYLIHLPELKKTRLYRNIQSYPKREASSGDWKTLSRIIPIHRFPEKTLYQFNPNLITKMDMTLDSWGN